MTFSTDGFIQVAQSSSPDVNIPPPTSGTQSTPGPSTPAPTDGQGTTIMPDETVPAGIAGVSNTDIVIGVAIIVVAALIAFFIRGAVRSHLITARKAGISSAGNAGWALFAFLMSIVITAAFGFIGQLWTVLPFVIPMGVLDVVTLILFVILFRSANRGRR